jgi:hypothetical protein
MNNLSFSIAFFGLALLFPSRNATAQTSIPVDHQEPIAIHVVDAQNGQPLAHLNLALQAGYDRSDIQKHLWHEDAMTDEHGVIYLPAALLNLPWLQVLMPKSSTCKANPHAQIFSVERMRNDGLSAPNRCGTTAVADRPGVFTVFAQGTKQAYAAKGSGIGTAVVASIKGPEIAAR